jgi:Restriction endonuclease
MSVLLLLGSVFNFVFSLWPLLFLTPLEGRKRNILRDMMILWALIFIGWLIARFESLPSFKLLIPEPLNTYLFFLTEIGLIGWFFFSKARERNFLHKTADTAQKPQDLLDVSPTQFEKMVLELYNLHGYKAKHTGTVGDHGVDIIVQTPKGEKWVIQCKRWRGSVGEPVIREFFGTMHHEKADRGVLITTGKFTPQATEWAKGKPLSLVDGNEFLATWKKEKLLS